MESIKIDTNSWHYKLLSFFDGSVSADDICEYRTNLIKAILACAIVTFLGSCAVWAVSVILVFFVFGLMTLFTLGVDWLKPESFVSFIVAIGMVTYTSASLGIAAFKIDRLQTKGPAQFGPCIGLGKKSTALVWNL